MPGRNNGNQRQSRGGVLRRNNGQPVAARGASGLLNSHFPLFESDSDDADYEPLAVRESSSSQESVVEDSEEMEFIQAGTRNNNRARNNRPTNNVGNNQSNRRGASNRNRQQA